VLAHCGEHIGAMIGLVDRALALNPSFARGWYASGALRLWAGQHDLAIEHAETSLRLSPRERTGTPLIFLPIAVGRSAGRLVCPQCPPGDAPNVPHRSTKTQVLSAGLPEFSKEIGAAPVEG
jgi:hypothetical protein